MNNNINKQLRYYFPNPIVRGIMIGAFVVLVFTIGWKIGRVLGGK